jgi:hypothetical protein
MSERAKTTAYLDGADYRRLKAIARKRRRPTAELLREAITEYVARHSPSSLKPRSVGAGHSGRGDLSEKAEDLLSGMGRR